MLDNGRSFNLSKWFVDLFSITHSYHCVFRSRGSTGSDSWRRPRRLTSTSKRRSTNWLRRSWTRRPAGIRQRLRTECWWTGVVWKAAWSVVARLMRATTSNVHDISAEAAAALTRQYMECSVRSVASLDSAISNSTVVKSKQSTSVLAVQCPRIQL